MLLNSATYKIASNWPKIEITNPMCGIAGFINIASSHSAIQLDDLAETMADTLKLRGPDGQGIWSDAETGIALAHRRLSIVDLSSAGNQPMISASSRFIITYNGEVYNFSRIQAELEARGCTFRGHSDTEVILESFAELGIEGDWPSASSACLRLLYGI